MMNKIDFTKPLETTTGKPARLLGRLRGNYVWTWVVAVDLGAKGLAANEQLAVVNDIGYGSATLSVRNVRQEAVIYTKVILYRDRLITCSARTLKEAQRQALEEQQDGYKVVGAYKVSFNAEDGLRVEVIGNVATDNKADTLLG